MNDIAATMLAHLTSSLRFEGSLNVDLNEVSMNLVPFRKFLADLLFCLSHFPIMLSPQNVHSFALAQSRTETDSNICIRSPESAARLKFLVSSVSPVYNNPR